MSDESAEGRADRLLSRLLATKRGLMDALYRTGRPFPGETAHDLLLPESAVEYAREAIFERDRLRQFAEFVAGYESEQQLIGSGVIKKAKEVADA